MIRRIQPVSRAIISGMCLLVLLSLFPDPARAADSIAALISDTSNPYWKSFEYGLRDSAAEQRVTVDIYTLQNATDAEGQLNGCEAALLKSPRAILFAAVNGMNLAACLKKAQQRAIALVDVDGNVDEKLAAAMGVTVAFSVASNNYDLGTKAAGYLSGKTGKVLVIEGLSGSQPNELRVKGFKEHLGPDFQIVGSHPAEWDRLKASEIAGRVIIQHPDLAVVFAANDTMALGAAESLRAVGKEGVAVIGIDGSSDAVKAIKEGRLTASVAQLPYLMAKEAVAKTVRYLGNRTAMSFHQYVPIVTLDAVTLGKADDPLLLYLR